MALVDDTNLIVLESKLKESNDRVLHKLRRYGATTKSWESLLDETDVLGSLHDPDLIVAALRLNRDDIVATAFIEPDVKFVDLYLANAFDRVGVNLGGVLFKFGCAVQFADRILVVVEDHNVHPSIVPCAKAVNDFRGAHIA